jgi:FG-GAP repeat
MKTTVIGVIICMLMMGTTGSSILSQTTTMPFSMTRNTTLQPCLSENWTQLQKLLASDGTFGDCFGCSVSIDGDTALIGAFGDRANGDLYGSAYIFTLSGTTWTQQAKIFPTSGGYYDFFGYAVALDGDTALIGAPGGIFNPPYPGAAYIFTRTGATWTQQARLTPSDGNDEDYFGNVVALDGDTAIIGSEYMSGIGSVYVFTRTDTTWNQQTKIEPTDGFAGEMFGYSVALQGNTALIGAECDNDNGDGSGSAYVYIGSGATWTQQAKLLASDGESLDFLGASVALYNNTALVGSEWDSDNGYKSGSAYVFTRTGTSWTQQAKLLAADGTAQDLFGHTVALTDDTALVGAYQDNATLYSSGSAYLFTRSGTTWTQDSKLLPSDVTEQKLFGVSVSLTADTALIGAYGESSGAGSAYLFQNTNYPPNPPIITGKPKGKTGTPITYNFTTIDPDNDQIYLFIDWGDDTNSSWIGPYNSGMQVTKTHTWSKKGTYTITAKAKDSKGSEGDWGTFLVTMPFSYDLPCHLFWERFFNRFPHAFHLLQHLMGD